MIAEQVMAQSLSYNTIYCLDHLFAWDREMKASGGVASNDLWNQHDLQHISGNVNCATV